jgi:hypothetical protein
MAIIYVGGTVAEPTDYTENYTESFTNPYDSNVYRTIAVGAEIKSTPTLNAYTWFSSDEKVLKMVNPKEKGMSVSIVGQKAGIATLSVGTSNGIVTSYNYIVTDNSNTSAYTLTGGREGSIAKEDGWLQIPITTTPAGAESKITWTSLNTSVATISDDIVTAQVENGSVIILGTLTDPWGIERTIPYLVIVGSGNGGGDPNSLIKGDDGKWYKPLGRPSYVYEVVEENGDSKEPPEYIYNPGGTPGDGAGDRDAYTTDDTVFYVEDPAGSNIYKQVDINGSLRKTPAIWGGPDNEFGTEDDALLVWLDDNGNYWVNVGQNIWQELIKAEGSEAADKAGNILGPLTGGGPDQNPATDTELGRPIYQHGDNTYYLGPMFDSEGLEYYIRDRQPGGNGSLDSLEGLLDGSDEVCYLVDGEMTTNKPTKPLAPESTPVDGRELTPEQTGDSVEWIEIARNGDYSLIIRSNYINTHINNKGFNWQYNNFGPNNNYKDSKVKAKVNDWFTGSAPGIADNLDSEARLRTYTYTNNAHLNPGTSSNEASMKTGLSLPNPGDHSRYGSDVAFVLSYAEAARYISNTRVVRGSTMNTTSSHEAKANYAKLTPHVNHSMWLRSQGDLPSTAGSMGLSPSAPAAGRVFQMELITSDRMYIYPALWVHQDIFSPVTTMSLDIPLGLGNADDPIDPEELTEPEGSGEEEE